MSKQALSLSGSISREDAAAMVEAYNPMGNTKCVWFSIEEISAITEKMRSPAAISAGVDGLRIYFAQYTAGTAPLNKQEYIGRNTLILVSTIADGDDHQDYLPANRGTEEDDGSVLANHGQLCPEQCRGAIL